MKTIWKTELAIQPTQDIMVPAGAEMLCAKDLKQKMCVWYLCDPEKPLEPRKIAMVVSGQVAPEGLHYLGTVYVIRSNATFHVFEWKP